ncbi:MAG: threonyl-tRNA synthetase editing domain-containing protein [Nanoarchaeota archaeon]
MKILMWHCKNFDVKITGIADRPGTIQPEEQRSENEQMKNCIVSMITLEVQDNDSTVEKAKKEIIKFAEDTKSKNIVLMPFVHLSNNIANSENSIKLIDLIEFDLKNKFNILRSHFGYHKELLLHTFGHKTNVRFREF